MILRPDSPIPPASQISSWERLVGHHRELLARYRSGNRKDRRAAILESSFGVFFGAFCFWFAFWVSRQDYIQTKYVGVISRNSEPWQFWAWVLFPAIIGCFFLYPVIRFGLALRHPPGYDSVPPPMNRAERRRQGRK